jgi:hypothetical protein
VHYLRDDAQEIAPSKKKRPEGCSPALAARRNFGLFVEIFGTGSG